MENRLGRTGLAALAFALAPLAVHAQYTAQPAQGALQYSSPYAAQHAAFSREQLEQMLAPIALYPDSVLSQLLVATTFPRQIAQAASWIRANPSLRGESAVAAAQSMGWDPSVASLTAFPQLLAQMEQNPQWTQSLGDAFLADDGRLMDAVQELRRRAQAAGTLRSDDQIAFQQNGAWIGIESAEPNVTYLPYYDPLVAYGSWPWASYPPVYWRPWAGYRYRPGYRFAWGPSVRYNAPHRASRFDWAARRFDFAGHRPSFQRRQEHQRVEGRRDFRQRAEAPRVETQRTFAPRVETQRAVAPRGDSNRFDARRFEGRRGVTAAPAAAAPAPAPAPQAAPRREASRQARQERRQHREAAPRVAPAPAAAPAARTAPASRPAPAAAAAPAQPREHGNGRGHRGDRDGRRG